MKRKGLTIAMPISSFLPGLGGMEVGLHNIAKRLAALGHRPIVMAPAGNVRALRSAELELPYQVVAFPPKMLTLIEKCPELALSAFAIFFAWVSRRYGIDVWHGTMGYPIGVALAYFGRDGGVPALVRCAGQDIQTDPEIGYGMRLDPAVDQIVRHWLPQVPLLVAITESVAEEYRALGVPEERILKIPNGVSLARFREGKPRSEVRRDLGFSDGVFLFLSVARNHPKKNLAAIVRASAVIKERSSISDWSVAIVGKDATALMPLVQELRLQDHVRLIEEIGAEGDDEDGDLPARALVDLYRAADAFVFPSLIETFGIAIIEAMAAGLPVIVGDSPGCRDVVQNGRYGLTVPPKDSTALATTMERLMCDKAEAERLRELSSMRAREYDWDSIVERYLAAYERLLTPAA